MATLVKKHLLEGERAQYVVGLWIGDEGTTISVTEDEDGSGDPFGENPNQIPLDDMLAICRKVRSLARWADTEKGQARINRLFDKETLAMAALQERVKKKKARKPEVEKRPDPA